MSQVIHLVKMFERNVMDFAHVKVLRRSEIRKFQDSRRKEIYEKMQLTDSQKNQIKELFEKNYGGGYTRYLAQTLYGIHWAV